MSAPSSRRSSYCLHAIIKKESSMRNLEKGFEDVLDQTKDSGTKITKAKSLNNLKTGTLLIKY